MEDSCSFKNLSGWKVSGSAQMEGSWWIAKTGTLIFIPEFSHDNANILIGGQLPTFGDEESVLLPVFDTGSIRPKNWRQQPQGLLDASLQVGHLPDALLVDLPLGDLNDPVHLLYQLLQHVRVLGKEVGQGGEGAGGRLEAGQDEDDYLANANHYDKVDEVYAGGNRYR